MIEAFLIVVAGFFALIGVAAAVLMFAAAGIERAHRDYAGERDD